MGATPTSFLCVRFLAAFFVFAAHRTFRHKLRLQQQQLQCCVLHPLATVHTLRLHATNCAASPGLALAESSLRQGGSQSRDRPSVPLCVRCHVVRSGPMLLWAALQSSTPDEALTDVVPAASSSSTAAGAAREGAAAQASAPITTSWRAVAGYGAAVALASVISWKLYLRWRPPVHEPTAVLDFARWSLRATGALHALVARGTCAAVVGSRSDVGDVLAVLSGRCIAIPACPRPDDDSGVHRLCVVDADEHVLLAAPASSPADGTGENERPAPTSLARVVRDAACRSAQVVLVAAGRDASAAARLVQQLRADQVEPVPVVILHGPFRGRAPADHASASIASVQRAVPDLVPEWVTAFAGTPGACTVPILRGPRDETHYFLGTGHDSNGAIVHAVRLTVASTLPPAKLLGTRLAEAVTAAVDHRRGEPVTVTFDPATSSFSIAHDPSFTAAPQVATNIPWTVNEVGVPHSDPPLKAYALSFGMLHHGAPAALEGMIRAQLQWVTDGQGVTLECVGRSATPHVAVVAEGPGRQRLRAATQLTEDNVGEVGAPMHLSATTVGDHCSFLLRFCPGQLG